MLFLTAALAGCSGGSGGISTASILGTAPTPPPVAPGQAPALPAAPTSDPTSRAFSAGSVAARAVKCGYNFDPVKLKASYLAHEVGLGATNEQVANIQKIYEVAFNGITKAAATQPDYCTEQKTKEIKADLTRLLAGDFEPPQRNVVAKKQDDDDSMFGDWFSGGSSGESGPSYGSQDWWDKQKEKAGG
jgi:hypothetical protein